MAQRHCGRNVTHKSEHCSGVGSEEIFPRHDGCVRPLDVDVSSHSQIIRFVARIVNDKTRILASQQMIKQHTTTATFSIAAIFYSSFVQSTKTYTKDGVHLGGGKGGSSWQTRMASGCGSMCPVGCGMNQGQDHSHYYHYYKSYGGDAKKIVYRLSECEEWFIL